MRLSGSAPGPNYSAGMMACVFFLLLFLSGCRTPALPPPDLQSPGWRIQQGQAVWTLPADRPEIAGDLLVATSTEGLAWLQFSKTPFPLVEARLESSRWWINFIPEQKAFTGMGVPPSRLAWLQLARSFAGTTPGRDWEFATDAEGGWRLRNRKTGEAIEGFLEPGR